MSGPQIVMWPILDEYSWYPDLDEAIAASPGESFRYRVCEERAPQTPTADELEWHVMEAVDSTVRSTDGEAEARIITSDSVQAAIAALADAMAFEAERNKLWYPVGDVLTYTPEALTSVDELAKGTSIWLVSGSGCSSRSKPMKGTK